MPSQISMLAKANARFSVVWKLLIWSLLCWSLLLGGWLGPTSSASFAEEKTPPGWDDATVGDWVTTRVKIRPETETSFNRGRDVVRTLVAVPKASFADIHKVRVVSSNGAVMTDERRDVLDLDPYERTATWSEEIFIGDKRFLAEVSEYREGDDGLHGFAGSTAKRILAAATAKELPTGHASRLTIYRTKKVDIPDRKVRLFGRDLFLDSTTIKVDYHYVGVRGWGAARYSTHHTVVDLAKDLKVGPQDAEKKLTCVQESISGLIFQIDLEKVDAGETDLDNPDVFIAQAISGENLLSAEVPGRLVRTTFSRGNYERTEELLDFHVNKGKVLPGVLPPERERATLASAQWNGLLLGGWKFALSSKDVIGGAESDSSWQGELQRAVAVLPDGTALIELRKVNSDFEFSEATYENIAATKDAGSDAALLGLSADTGWRRLARSQEKLEVAGDNTHCRRLLGYWVSNAKNGPIDEPRVELFRKQWHPETGVRIPNFPSLEFVRKLDWQVKRNSFRVRRTACYWELVTTDLKSDAFPKEFAFAARIALERTGDAETYESHAWMLELLNADIPGGRWASVRKAGDQLKFDHQVAWGEMEDAYPQNTKDLIVLLARHEGVKLAALKALHKHATPKTYKRICDTLDEFEAKAKLEQEAAKQ